MASESDRISLIQHGIRTPFWNDWLLPTMQERGKQMARALASKRADDDDVKRGWFQAMEWLINLPAQEIAAYESAQREAEAVEAAQHVDEERARLGMRSPFRVVEVGETKSAPEPAQGV